MYRREVAEDILRPLRVTTWRYYVLIAFLLLGVLFGAYAYYIQITSGLIVTGLRDNIFWGLYITNFVFFIGISHAGTLISAVLRLARAEWRKPVTRMAEYITVMALFVGGLQPLIDLGRIDRILNILFYGRIQSPIVWDFISITTYLVGSMTYLYLPLIPDLAICRDLLGDVSGFKRWIYEKLSMNWRWGDGQRAVLGKAIAIMTVLIVPIMITVHTVVSWIFAMTFRAGWRSTIFGIYFVVGALLSGLATVITFMAIVRKAYRFEKYIRYEHFKYFGYLLLAVDLFYIYLMINEYQVSGYLWSRHEAAVLSSLYGGKYAIYFWATVFMLVAPIFIIAIPRTRTINGILVASIIVNISMWLKRYVIIVPTLANPPMPSSFIMIYTPSWIEAAITIGSFCGFGLLIAIFSKLFPLISIWEVSESEE